MTKTKNIAIIVTAALALVGAITVSQTQKKNSRPDPSQAQEESTPAMLAESNAADITRKSQGDLRKRAKAEYPDLVAKYGESRTNLSKHVARQIIGLHEEFTKINEVGESTQPDTSVFTIQSLGTVGEELELNEQQLERVAALYDDYKKREQEKSSEMVSSLKKDSTALMTIMLSGDSFARGEMTADEYRKEVQTALDEKYVESLNVLNLDVYVGIGALKDDVFRVEFEKTLEPVQVEKLTAALADQDAREAELNDLSLIADTDLPAIRLEQLDEMVTPLRKAAAGGRRMMEGMKSLHELNQDTDQQE